MNSRRLRRTIALSSGSLRAHIREFWEHPRLGELYPEFLFATYGVICASTPMMTYAAEEAALRSEEDPLARLLEPYLREHAVEEAGHEKWLLADLERCGIERSRALSRLPYPSAAALAGAQYYWARHVHPVAFLGYLAVLENPASPAYLEKVAARTGLPIEAMYTHMQHARLDEGHVAEFDEMLDGLPLSPAQDDILATSAIASVALLDAFFVDVLRHFERAEDEALVSTLFTFQKSSRATDQRPAGADAAAVIPPVA